MTATAMKMSLQNLSWKWVECFCDYSTLYEMCQAFFHFCGANGFHLKTENKRFTAAGSFCLQNLKFCIWQIKVKEMYLKACCTCGIIPFLRSTNHVTYSWRCRRHYNRRFQNRSKLTCSWRWVRKFFQWGRTMFQECYMQCKTLL